MKRILFTVFVLLFLVGCEDGRDGPMGPSGIDELTENICSDGQVLETDVDANGLVTVECVDAPDPTP